MNKELTFVAIDVETANSDMSSICQIGLAVFKGEDVVDEWSSLINPQTSFSKRNISIHGITEKNILGAPTFKDVLPVLTNYLENSISVCHMHFDRVAINKACDCNCTPHINTIWLDSAKVARHAWEQCAFKGYGLANVCKLIGYNFAHHDALEDAKAAGQVMIAAIDKTGIGLHAWLERSINPIKALKTSLEEITEEDCDPDGIFANEVVVFSGSLSISRKMASGIVKRAGGTIGKSVTKKTTILVVGVQDLTRLAPGKSKSSKHLKAEDYIDKGQQAKIFDESEFKALLKQR